MIQFKKIHINNFLTIGDVELEFEQGMFLVKGENLDNQMTRSNGAGKSNLFAAVSYCLFGSTPAGKTSDDVVNLAREKNCSVILELESNSVAYRIERYRKHSKHKNNVRVFINGEDKSEHTAKASQILIDSIINIDATLFNSIIILAQGLENRFSILKETARREIIQGIRNNQIWDRSRELVKKDISLNQIELSDINVKTSSATTLLASKKESARSITSNIASLREKLTTSGSESDISIIETALRSSKDKGQTFQQQIDSATIELAEIDKLKDSLSLEITNLRQVHAEKNKRQQYVISRIENKVTRCESCQTILSEATEEELSAFRTERDRLFNELNDLVFTGTKKSEEVNELVRKKTKLQNIISTAYQEINRHNSWMSEQNSKLSTLRTFESSINSQIDLLTTQLQDITVNLEAIVAQINQLTTKRDELTTKAAHLQQLDKLFSPKGIQAYLLSKDIEFLNSRLLIYSEYLFSSETIYLDSGLSQDGEVSKLSIQLSNSKTGKTSEYNDRSGGEKRRIDLAIQLALRDLVMSVSLVNTNLLVLDEVFEGIDSEGIVHVLEMLRNIIGLTYSTFVITHVNDIAYEYFNGELSLLRKDEVTALVQG